MTTRKSGEWGSDWPILRMPHPMPYCPKCAEDNSTTRPTYVASLPGWRGPQGRRPARQEGLRWTCRCGYSMVSKTLDNYHKEEKKDE